MDTQLRLFCNRLRHALCAEGGSVEGCHVPATYSFHTGRDWKDDVALADLPPSKTLVTLDDELPDRFELIRDDGAGVLRVRKRSIPEPCRRRGCTWGFSCDWQHDVTREDSGHAHRARHRESYSRSHSGHGESRHGDSRYGHSGEPRYGYRDERGRHQHSEPRPARQIPRHAGHSDSGYSHAVHAARYGRKEAEPDHGSTRRTHRPRTASRTSYPKRVDRVPTGYIRVQRSYGAPHREGGHRGRPVHAPRSQPPAPLADLEAEIEAVVAELAKRQLEQASTRGVASGGNITPAPAPSTSAAGSPASVPRGTRRVERRARARVSADVVADGDAQLAALLGELGVSE